MGCLCYALNHLMESDLSSNLAELLVQEPNKM